MKLSRLVQAETVAEKNEKEFPNLARLLTFSNFNKATERGLTNPIPPVDLFLFQEVDTYLEQFTDKDLQVLLGVHDIEEAQNAGFHMTEQEFDDYADVFLHLVGSQMVSLDRVKTYCMLLYFERNKLISCKLFLTKDQASKYIWDKMVGNYKQRNLQMWAYQLIETYFDQEAYMSEFKKQYQKTPEPFETIYRLHEEEFGTEPPFSERKFEKIYPRDEWPDQTGSEDPYWETQF